MGPGHLSQLYISVYSTMTQSKVMCHITIVEHHINTLLEACLIQKKGRLIDLAKLPTIQDELMNS